MNNNPSHSKTDEVVCPSCSSHFFVLSKTRPKYCSYCGKELDKAADTSLFSDYDYPTVPDQLIDEDQVQFSIGQYQILSRIGKGGMGEVFLSYDPTCGRKIALKRVRTDLDTYKTLKRRFLKEARITAQLTHPAIIPIYSIHEDGDAIYYTMPYVEGQTLREIINKARKKDLPLASIPSLTRILISVCQAISYAHSHGVLHRDIKGENIIIGKFGEVMILDWGLTKLTEQSSDDDELAEVKSPSGSDITKIGKVVGTISYMAPERARGHPATKSTDIYALGVLLYVMLTLRSPFKRGSLEEFREKMDKEVIKDPSELAPYRDVPPILSRICLKCLEKNPDDRYQSVEEMIHDLESYIEGRSEWFEVANLDINQKKDWLFQEHVLMSGPTAITRSPDLSDWVALMISKGSFNETVQLRTRVKVEDDGHGIGLLLSIPEAAERRHLNDGYCLWIGTESHRATKLMRSTVEVLHAPEIFLNPGEWYDIRIEKIDHNIYFYLNDILQFSYVSHIPLAGTHIGVIYRDTNFEMTPLSIYTGNESVMVNCLAVPDAFFAHKDFEKALIEYKRIGYTFPGRAEGREAMFRAGVTLIEQSRHEQSSADSEELLEKALDEFEKLKETPGAPLEYLGKALVYKALGDIDEEIKCYMLAYRRYRDHPLLNVLEEQVVYRMHECSRYQRRATYELVFLALRHIPQILKIPHTEKLIDHLQKDWEKLPFIQEDPCVAHSTKIRHLQLSLVISFWLATPYFLDELLTEVLNLDTLYPILVFDLLYAVLEIGDLPLLEAMCKKVIEERPREETKFLSKNLTPFAFAIKQMRHPDQNLIPDFLASIKRDINFNEMRLLLFLMEHTLVKQKPLWLTEVFERINTDALNTKQKLRLDIFQIWSLLLQKKWEEAGELFHRTPIELISDESSPLHFLYGCFLAAVEGLEIAKAHFSGILEVPFPRSWTLATHYLNGHLNENNRWMRQAFMWEKRQLYKQLSLYYHCVGDEENSKLFHNYARQQVMIHDTP